MIPFIDLAQQQKKIRLQISQAFERILDHGQYIMGPEVLTLEQDLQQFCGAKNVISCSNGTDAMSLFLMAEEEKRPFEKDDVIFLPAFTFAATAAVISRIKACPFFVDVLENTYNMDPESLKKALLKARKLGLKGRGLIVVDLFGQPAEYLALQQIAKDNDLWLLCDSAQSFGASYLDKNVGLWGDITTTSFFPAKPLGAYGDAGAIFTENDQMAEIIKSLRIHGQGQNKYENIRVGTTGRMDTLQAAVLIEKLKIFPEERKARSRVAQIYDSILSSVVKTPKLIEGATSVWAQYTLILPSEKVRPPLMQFLHEKGIPSVIYYPQPLSRQPAFSGFPNTDGVPVSCHLAERVLSLPMHGYLSDEQAHFIAQSVASFFDAVPK
jgi:dTDP-4-amino-4,6-dideoxygalactose transaminase